MLIKLTNYFILRIHNNTEPKKQINNEIIGKHVEGNV